MSKEAMKLALEALENFEKAGLATLKTIDAITAIKEALANDALDKMAENERELGIQMQPEPEPVAWITQNGKGWLRWHKPDDNNTDSVPLYKSPPKREWQGLTDEEIDEGQRQSWVEKQAFESAVWWAEAKLKEKNT